MSGILDVKSSMSKEEKKTLNKILSRSRFINAVGTQAQSQGNVFLMSLAPVLDELYKDNDEERIAAYVRHTQYFNCQQTGTVFLIGMAYGLEKQHAAGKIPGSAVQDVKLSLMGPLAGILDPIYMTVIRVIAAGIGMSLAATGSLLGPIVFFLIYGGTQFFGKYFGIRLGYTLGDKALEKLFGSGLVKQLTSAASILGLMMMGCMTSTTVKADLAWIINAGTVSVDVQAVLDSIFPGLLSVIITLVVMKLVKNKVSVMSLCLWIIGICILLAAVHII